MNNLRLVILNTWKCEGDYYQRLQAMMAELMALQPDIVALQESFHSVDGRLNTARDVAEALGMDFYLLSNRRKKRILGSQTLDSYSGLAILSALPVKETWEYAMPSISEDGDRSALLAHFSLADTEFIVVNLHLTHIRNRDDARAMQLRALLEHCKQFNQNAILCGDFNSPLRNLNRAGVLAPKGELRDTWALAGGNYPKPPSLHSAYRSVGVEFEHGSIDHIMYLPQSKPELTFSNPDRVFEHPDPTFDVLASDHMGWSITISAPSGSER